MPTRVASFDCTFTIPSLIEINEGSRESSCESVQINFRLYYSFRQKTGSVVYTGTENDLIAALESSALIT